MSVPVEGFQHEALLYRGTEGFLAAVLPFIREALADEEPILVAVGAEKLARLRAELGDRADDVCFADMAELGRNPARIIPAWHEFLAEHRRQGRGIRGIGEPIWAGRTHAELVEAQLHESLLNLAFAATDGFRLLCPYDETALDAGVVHEACCSHPLMVEDGGLERSDAYRDGDLLAPFDMPLPHPSRPCEVIGFERDGLADVRRLVARRGNTAGLAGTRIDELVLAASEAATNSVLHGGGRGIARVWAEDDAVVCEIKDRGHIRDPLVGRIKPHWDQIGGWGVWLANQVCDLVQLRSGPGGTAIRLSMRLD